MTRGVVIFAISTPEIDYAAMARWSQQRIQRHLGLPVTIIKSNQHAPGQRWFGDIGANVTWHNTNRMDAYNLSPYDETLVLDADYVVSSDVLLSLFDCSEDFLCMGRAYDVTNLEDDDSMNTFGRIRMNQAWATVMFFRRGDHSRRVFDMMSMIRDNWAHYRDVYAFERTAYRNDYALSIALNTLNGHWAQWPVAPWAMASISPQHELEQIGADEFQVSYMNTRRRRMRVTLRDQDFHAMCKQQLGAIVENSK